MRLDLFNKRRVDIRPRRRIVLQPIKEWFTLFPQILIKLSNVVQRPKESLQLCFVNNDISEFVSKLDSSIDGTNVS